MDSVSTVPLGELIRIKHGYAFESASFSSDGPYVLLTPGNFLESGGFRWLGDKQKFYVGNVPPDFVLNAGDMLVAMTEQAPGLLGSTFFVPDGHIFLHNQRLGLIHITAPERLSDEFLHYFMALSVVRRRISSESAGTKVKHTSPDRLYQVEIPLPPLEQQRKIAEILRTWDEAIDATSRLIAAKRRRLDALTVGLVFGTLRLPQFATAGDQVEGRWFDVPSGCSIPRISKVAHESSRRNADGAVSEVLSCSKYDGFVRSLEYFKKQVYSADLTTYKIIARGEFGFPSNHIEEGSIGLQDLEDLAVVSPIYTIFRFDSDRVDNRFAIRVLKTSLYRHIFEVSTSSSVDRRGSLRWSEFSRLPFPLPPLDEQQAIAAILDAQAREIEVEATRLDALQRQKRGLMQKLLTGEWRVPGAAVG